MTDLVELAESNPLPLTDSERTLLDEVIDSMVAKVAQYELKVDHPVWFRLQFNADACQKIDGVIAPVFDALRSKKIEDFAEKLSDRLMLKSSIGDPPAMGLLAIRLMDTMDCIIGVKGKYRGKPCVSSYDKKKATEELRKRNLLK